MCFFDNRQKIKIKQFLRVTGDLMVFKPDSEMTPKNLSNHMGTLFASCTYILRVNCFKENIV